MGSVADSIVTLTGNILVFCLVFGMSATVDTKCLKTQLKNAKAIMTGIILQFLLMPFLGFLLVKSLDLEHVTGLMILIVTCSPGGSYSNWWCSIANADLALSVSMTAISTVISVVMLPFNLYVYAKLTYADDVLALIDFSSLFASIATVIFGLAAGFYASYHFNNHDFNLNANRLGNFAGIALIIYSLIMSNSNDDYQLWDRDWDFYFGVAAPCFLGLTIATGVTTGLWLLAPERVTVSIECCYQNVGIAISVASAIFNGDELAQAIGVPVYYGIVETILVSIYCFWAWKLGWTKAPTDVSLWKAITTSYEVKVLDEAQSGDIQMPSSEKSQQTGSDWNYVDYGDAGANEPKSSFIDYTDRNAKKSAEPEKKDVSSTGGWFGFL